MNISPARRAAFEILRRVEGEGAYSSALLAATGDLDTRDRALCHELVLGVLRRRLWLDSTLEHLAGREIEKFDLPVVLALRLGLYQLRFLSRIPPSAAVNESVNLVRTARLKSAAGFVNAVLRRATREADYDPTATITEPTERIATQTSHPPWLIDYWRAEFGEEQAFAIAAANNETPPVIFRLTAKSLGRAEQIVSQLQTAGAELTPSSIAHRAWRMTRRGDESKGKIESANADGQLRLTSSAQISGLARQLSEEGLIHFQDEASQLVAQLLNVQDGERVLDVCAAPGGKSTLIATTAPNSIILAGDLHEHRVRAMRQLAHRQSARNVAPLVHDAARGLPFAERSFDQVLVDAPCSGTGTLRQNPEIRWRLKQTDFAELAMKQKVILQNAAAVVRVGGLLVYSTCSLEIAENEAVVSEFINANPGFARSPFAVTKLVTGDGAVRTWPHRNNTDGFFAAAFRRTD